MDRLRAEAVKCSGGAGFAGREHGIRWSEQVVRVGWPGDAGKVALLLIVGIEEEELVADKRAAQAEAPLLAPVGWLGGNAGVIPCRVRYGEQRVRVTGSAQIDIAVVKEKLAVKFVGAALGHGIDDAACGAAVLRGVVRGVDLKLLNGDGRDRIGSARAAAGLGVVGLVVVGAVNGIVVEQVADAAEAEQTVAV